MNIILHLKNINLAKKNKYDIIASGDCMKGIVCTDIQSLMQKNINTEYVIEEIRTIMKQEYPDYIEWFNEKLVPGLNVDRNIVFLLKNHKIIGFVNLKKTNKENKMSNLYIKPSLYYKKHWDLLINHSIEWLEDYDPVMIISKKEINKCHFLLVERNWYVSDKRKNNDFVINRPDEIEKIKRILKTKKTS